MSSTQLVIGAGPVGATVARQLLERGDDVTVLTRSGTGPADLDVRRVAGDATDPDTVRRALGSGTVIHHAMHGSAYDAATWERELFAAERTVLDVAADRDATVVFPESLYSYRHDAGAMTERSPRDAAAGKRGIRTALLAGRAAAPARTISVVASDFYGPRVRTAHAGERLVPVVLAGRRVLVLGSPDLPHSWTYIPDLAAAMITAADRADDLVDPTGRDRVLHAPTAAPLSQRELAAAFTDAAGAPAPKLSAMPYAVLWAAGLVDRNTRGLREVWYQFAEPFVMDSTASEQALGLRPTPVAEAAAATVAWWRDGAAASPSAPSWSARV